jgi:hypothetical protein
MTLVLLVLVYVFVMMIGASRLHDACLCVIGIDDNDEQ